MPYSLRPARGLSNTRGASEPTRMNMIKNRSGNESKSSRGQDEASLQKGKRENPGTGLVLVNKSFHPYIQVGGSARVTRQYKAWSAIHSLNETNFIVQFKG